jgi:predicted secreted protein
MRTHWSLAVALVIFQWTATVVSGAAPGDCRPGTTSPTPAAKGKDALCPTRTYDIEIYTTDKGKTMTASVGKTLILRLPGTQATGAWRLTKLTGDALRQQGEVEYHPNASGGAGSYIFKFQAVKPGKVELKAAYFPTGKSAPPVNFFTVYIVVKKPDPTEQTQALPARKYWAAPLGSIWQPLPATRSDAKADRKIGNK